MSPHDIYLETQVHTATPQRLRLMLIEAAIRSARQTAEHWKAMRHEVGLESLIRCRAFVSELIAGINREESSLSQQVANLYIYLFSTLTEAQLTRDETALAAAIRVLEEERETWQEVCRQLTDAPRREQHAAHGPREETAPARVSGSQSPVYGGGFVAPVSAGLSLDA